ncbi:sensor histidine kinase [Mangrovihabitans endophyticus]|uniref:Sensor-like histidine kinase SenX3 n=1 Tax=Mangrovihabitans endophyticus TaxID=1751298 RepID=A0A8J3C742_9ACTN|nr:ATP-binding protein [Mangrovihabitans endophyticus]GGL15061.1 hypothetical protein GCM10012284_57150 [Mangrovihabitans endophyticus]
MFLLGVAGSFAAGDRLHQIEDDRLQRETYRSADIAEVALTDMVQSYSRLIGSIARATSAQSDLTATDFDTLADAARYLPGAVGASFVVPASPGQVAQVQRTWRARVGPALTLKPADDVAEHRFIVLYREFDGDGTVLGLDVAQLSAAAEALSASRTTGAPAITAPVVLAKDQDRPASEQRPSITLQAPVVAANGTDDAGTFRGWVSMAFRLDPMLQTALRNAGVDDVSVTVQDITAPGQPLTMSSLAPADSTVADAAPAVARDFPATRRLWRLTVQPSQQMVNDELAGTPQLVEVGGTVLSLLLAALAWVLAWSRVRAIRQVKKATADLRADVARREAAELSLRTSEAELQAFTEVAASRMQGPLREITEYATLVAENDELTPRARRRATLDIESNAETMGKLVHDLLLYSQVREVPLARQSINLAGVIPGIAEEVVAAVRPGEPVTIEVDALCTVDGDRRLLGEVFRRLLENALLYTPEMQIPEVRVSADLDGASWRGESWRIEITDNGTGLAESERPKVLTAFYRAANAEGIPGNGLGLAICQRIVERHGGQIGLNANPGGGCVAWVTLPLPARSAGSAGAAPQRTVGGSTADR